MNNFEWTPVGRVLPAVNEKVLVTCETTKGERLVNHGYLDERGKFHAFCNVKSVIAWMPLPRPYMEGGDAA